MRLKTILLALGTTASFPAMAQTAQTDDVVVMRRHLTPPRIRPVTPPTSTPTPSPTPVPTPTPATGNWVIISYGSWSSGCSDNATRSVVAECRRAGAALPDSACSADPRPTQETGPNLASCQFSWRAGDWQEWSSTCSTSATRNRTFTCYRTDGTNHALDVVAPDASCTQTRPTESEGPSEVSSGCTVDWDYGAWRAYNSTCSNAATRTRAATCKGYVPPALVSTGFTVSSNRCTTPAETSQTTGRYTGCAAQEALAIYSVPRNSTTERTVSGLQTGSSYVLTITGNADSDNQFDALNATIYVNGTPTSNLALRSRYFSPATYNRTFTATGPSMTIGIKNNSSTTAANFSQTTLSLVRTP